MENKKPERPNTVAGLMEKRALLAGMLKYHRAEERKVICDLDHIDAAIRLFDATADMARIARYPTKHRAKKGEVIRLVIRMLKETDHPLTALDIVHQQVVNRRQRRDPFIMPVSYWRD